MKNIIWSNQRRFQCPQPLQTVLCNLTQSFKQQRWKHWCLTGIFTVSLSLRPSAYVPKRNRSREIRAARTVGSLSILTMGSILQRAAGWSEELSTLLLFLYGAIWNTATSSLLVFKTILTAPSSSWPGAWKKLLPPQAASVLMLCQTSRMLLSGEVWGIPFCWV